MSKHSERDQDGRYAALPTHEDDACIPPKRTPGPWALDLEVNEQGPCIFPPEGHRHQSAIAVIYDYRDPETKKQLSSVLADARLIAAAPELLEALKEVIEAQWRARPINSTDADRAALLDANEKARTAIAKAEGRS